MYMANGSADGRPNTFEISPSRPALGKLAFDTASKTKCIITIIPIKTNNSTLVMERLRSLNISELISLITAIAAC